MICRGRLIGLIRPRVCSRAKRHIPIAATPDPSSAAPVTGDVDDCEVVFSHEMSVRRIRESPRVTKPYSDEQWASIVSLGRQIDRDLADGDVRLTMGGEPTFVSIDDMDGEEWNTAAVGRRKREIVGTLVKRLRDRFAPGGLLHYGQGKWYPGESLPRWALGCWWRRDGQPIWHDAGLVADESVDYGHGDRDARCFIDRLSRILGVDARHVAPAYEDTWYYLWRERRLPVNVDPLKSNLEDEEERRRLSKVFERGLAAAVGYVLPLRRQLSDAGPRWESGPWFLRSEHMFLIPGDSPIGYRLPLDSLPWVSPDEYPHIYPRDPAAPLPALASQQPHIVTAAADARPQHAAGRPPEQGQSAPGVVRTAHCVEPRHGRLHIFMPPVVAAEDYLDLVAAVERTSADLGLPVIVEGEPPPDDPRLNHLNVTPDPGVIEVNLHPAQTWDELVCQTTVLYEEARQSRLGTEKFMLDGRHSGPAAAITSCSAARRLQTARCSGDPTCCEAWS